MRLVGLAVLGISIRAFTACLAQEGNAGAAASLPNEAAGFIGRNAFTRLDLLPFLRQGVETRQFCSYDRAGDNYDGEYFPLYTNSDGECVIFDAMGPGCLYRHHINLWMGQANYQGIHIRYYFDDEPAPRIDMDVSTFFSGSNPLGIFLPPLAYDGKDRFRVMYHPMFFKRRLKVALSAEPGGPSPTLMPWPGRYSDLPNRRYHWYEYTYQLFAQDPGLESWTPESARRDLPAMAAAWAVNRLGADPKPAMGNKARHVWQRVRAGRTARLLRLRGAGSISALSLRLNPVNVGALFDTWLKITFDGAAAPQIEAPAGCFFGAYRTSLESSYASLALGYAAGAGYCYLPMPYWKSATIELENRGTNLVSVDARVVHKSAAAMPYPRQRCAYLFARYHREDPRVEGRDYTYFETSGCGQIVGDVIGRWDTSMEENERTYFDASQTPWIIGDGFEDDHGMGWGLQNLTQPVFGAFSATDGVGAVYRFFIPDLYCFNNGVKHGHQTYGPHSPLGHEGMYSVGKQENVTFLYANPTPRLILTDELDVGDAASETAHAYTAEGDVQRTNGAYWYDGEFNNVLWKTPAIRDDGVSFTGHSSFRVAIARGNRGLRLRRRCNKENNRQCARVFIDGQQVRERPWYSVDFEKTYRGIRWLDTDFEVPPAYTEGKDKVQVRIEFLSSKTGRWDEYHYWIYSY